jgi:hypothetical protein
VDELEVEVGRPGAFNAYRGGRVELDEAALRHLADGFDPNRVHKLKLGHESGTAAPAYGTVIGLRFDAFKKRLFATIRPVAELARWIREGRYPDRSMELGRAAGRFVFRHLAFLGDAEPAIGGLAPIRMATVESAGGAQMIFLSEEVDLCRFELSAEQRRQSTPSSVAVHDLVLAEMREAAAAGEVIAYTVGLERAASRPQNRRVFAQWL